MTHSVVQQLQRTFDEKADQVALVQGQDQWTYADLDRRSASMAAHLRGQGVGPGSRVVVHANRSVDYVIAMVSTLRCGGVFVPVASDQPLARLKHIIEEVKPTVVITDSVQRMVSLGLSQTLLLDLTASRLEETADDSWTSVDANDLAYIMYTSGSTGKPKGVMIAHGALSNYLTAAMSKYSSDEVVQMPLFTSIGFDLTVTSLFLPLITGGVLHVYPEEHSGFDSALLEVVNNRRVNVIKMTPSHAQLLLELDLSGTRWKTIILGGESLRTELVRDLTAAMGEGVKVFNEYGPTEHTVGCAVAEYSPDVHTEDVVPIGKPFAGTEVLLLNSQGKQVARGVAGEIYLTGAGLAEGYWDQPELTAKAFLPIPPFEGQRMYRTGDLARINERDELVYLGRMDSQLKVGGIRVEASEIESAILGIDGVEQVVLDLRETNKDQYHEPEHYCSKCGIPSNYPSIEFDSKGVCNLCRGFETYQRNVGPYFRTLPELRAEITQRNTEK